jgi:hypothetical protein
MNQQHYENHNHLTFIFLMGFSKHNIPSGTKIPTQLDALQRTSLKLLHSKRSFMRQTFNTQSQQQKQTANKSCLDSTHEQKLYTPVATMKILETRETSHTSHGFHFLVGYV